MSFQSETQSKYQSIVQSPGFALTPKDCVQTLSLAAQRVGSGDETTSSLLVPSASVGTRLCHTYKRFAHAQMAHFRYVNIFVTTSVYSLHNHHNSI